MAGEREALLVALVDALEGLEKRDDVGPFTINYTPSNVVRVRGFDEAFLDTSRDLVYFVVAGDETNEPDTNHEYLALWEVFVVACKVFQPDREDPFFYKGKPLDKIQNELVDDMKAAITSVGASPPQGIDDVDPADFRPGGADFEAFIYIECRVLVDYDWQAVSS